LTIGRQIYVLFNSTIMAEERKNPGTGTANRGFASMDRERQREIARKGGATVSQNRAHMAEIGRRGGEASGASRSNRATQNRSQNQEQVNQEQNETKP
jgi:uncharacterized protein